MKSDWLKRKRLSVKAIKILQESTNSGEAGSEATRLAKKWINNQHQSPSLIQNDSHHCIYCMWVRLWTYYDPSPIWLLFLLRNESSTSFNHISIFWSKRLLIFWLSKLNLYELQDAPKYKSLKKLKDETFSFLACVCSSKKWELKKEYLLKFLSIQMVVFYNLPLCAIFVFLTCFLCFSIPKKLRKII